MSDADDNQRGSRSGQTGRGSDGGIEEFDLRSPDDLDVRSCYRHPDRETGVSCSNCGRPICYECMVQAPVGFRCPDCAAERRGGLRVVGGTGGARRTASRRRPQVISRQQTRARWQSGYGAGSYGATNQVTRILVGINVLVFVAELVFGAGVGGMTDRTAASLGGLWPAAIAEQHQYWRFITAMFLHASIIHILFNMWALWIVGSYLEAVTGRGKYLLLYFLSGVAGNVFGYLFGSPNSVMIGASTAIFGLFGALFVYSYNNRHSMAGMMLRNIGFIIVINLIITFMVRGISWQGHIGGLLGGMAVMEAMTLFGRKDLRAPFGSRDLAAVLAVAAVLLIAVVWRTVTF